MTKQINVEAISVPAQQSDILMEFGKYPADWHSQTSRTISPTSKVSGIRRPSNPIAIPRPQYTRKPSIVSPISPLSPAICSKCGLHSRPSAADIIETGGCSPSDHRIQSYFPDTPSGCRGHRSGSLQHWPTDQCCEGWCPDTIMPSQRRLSSVDSGYSTGSADGQRRRHHHRRKSSLCYGQNLIDEEEEVKWRCDRDILVNDKNEADKIARKIVARSRRGSKASSGAMSNGSAI